MEKSFSIFLIIENQLITSISYVTYNNNGDDFLLQTTMKENVLNDINLANKIPLQIPIPYDDYFSALRIGRQSKYYEIVFLKEKILYDPLVLVTPVINGHPHFDITRDHSSFSYDELKDHKLEDYAGPDDYLKTYILNGSFDLPGLIDDDYLKAFKLLLNNGYYVSAAKLLFSCIDSIAFIEFGDISNSFKKWIDTYTDLGCHGINSGDLWEMRNGYLHMTSTSSRKVIKGDHPAIILFVGPLNESEIPAAKETKYLNLHLFYKTICNGLQAWIISYKENPEKFQEFVKRYDLTVSDSRLAKSNLK